MRSSLCQRVKGTSPGQWVDVLVVGRRVGRHGGIVNVEKVGFVAAGIPRSGPVVESHPSAKNALGWGTPEFQIRNRRSQIEDFSLCVLVFEVGVDPLFQFAATLVRGVKAHAERVLGFLQVTAARIQRRGNVNSANDTSTDSPAPTASLLLSDIHRNSLRYSWPRAFGLR